MDVGKAVMHAAGIGGDGMPSGVDQRFRIGVFASGQPRRAWVRVLRWVCVAAVAVAGGLAVRVSIQHFFGIRPPYMAYFPWIVAACAVGGAAAGGLTLAGFILISFLVLRSATLLPLSSPPAAIGLFFGAGALLILITELALRLRARTRQANATLRQSEERLFMALEAASQGTWEWNIASGEVIWSATLEKIHGRMPGSFAGTLDDALANVHPDDLARVTSTVYDALERRSEFQMEYRIVNPDRQERWLESRGRVFCDADGQAVRMMGTCMDITDRRQAQDAIRVSEQRYRAVAEEAERAGRVKDQFLAVLSHELRTPLSPVLLTISLLEMSPELPASLRDAVASARRNIELEARLIDDLLDLTRIARGKIQYDFQPVELHALIHSAIGICCNDSKISLHTDFAAGRSIVRGDSARLQQVFCNLLSNAWKFTAPGGSVAIRTENAGDCVRVEVIDTGAGIEPAVLPKIFDAFEQGDPVAARKFGGLGLGLAIAKALVDAHGGLISAWSEGPGTGARFRVELPTAPPADAVAVAPQAPPIAGQRPLRMLLVEDHPSTLAALERLLNSIGHEVHGVSCVADALQAMRHSQYDLLISDLGLPDGTGYELMHQLRTQHGLRGIALSGFGMDEDRARSREAGFADHLVKPVDLHQLQSAISRVVQEGQGE